MTDNHIDTSQLRGDDWSYVLGWLLNEIEKEGQATRETAEKAIAAAIRKRAQR